MNIGNGECYLAILSLILIYQLFEQGRKLMATLQALNDATVQLQETADMVIAQYTALKENGITPAQLDAPVASINETRNKLLAAIQA